MKTKEYLLHDGPDPDGPEETASTRSTTYTRQLSNLSSCSSIGRDSVSRPGSPPQVTRQLSNLSSCSSAGRDSASKARNPRQPPGNPRKQQRSPSNKQRPSQKIESPRKMAKSQSNTSLPHSPPPKKTAAPSTNPKTKGPSTTMTTHNPNKQTKSVLETQYLAKKKGFVYMLKELMEKQKHIIEVHATIKELRNRVFIETGKDLEMPEEIKLIDIENIKIPDMRSPGKTAKGQGGENARQAPKSLNKLGTEIQEKMGTIQRKCSEFCNHLFSRRQALMDWLLSIKESYGIEIDNPTVQEKFELHIREGDSLKIQHEEIVAAAKSLTDILLKDVDTYMAKTQESVHEKQENIKQLTTRLQAALKENKKLNELLQYATKQIECSSIETQTLRKSKAAMEEKLRCIHGKLKEMDTKSDTSEKSVRELEEKNKVLEMKLRNTEKNNDLKLREANKKLTVCNTRITKLESEKRSLEERILKQKHEIDTKSSIINKLKVQQAKLKQKSDGDDETGHINELKNQISELQLKTEKEISEKEALIQLLQTNLTDTQHKMQEEISVKMKIEKECKNQKQLVNKFHQNWEKLQDIMETVLETTACKHSSLEKSLWKKLQSTKRQLTIACIENAELSTEQKKFMELFKQFTENKDIKSLIDNIHQMLNQKDEFIKKLKQETVQLKAVSKRSKETLMIMKHQLSEHQNIIATLSDRGAISAEMKLLSAQVGDLRTTLAQVLSHNEELRQALISKQIMADQSTKLVLEQQKVQQDLCNIIQGKERWPEEEINLLKAVVQGGEKTINELIKKEQLEMLNEMMHSKEEQVMKLENIVKELREHQEQCQQQRVQYEARIALLMDQVQKQKQQTTW